jgi:hypothetical protein
MYVTNTFWDTLCAMFGRNGDTNTIPMLRKWQEFEGGNAEWNPLNTTEHWPNATLYNSAGVRNYRTQEDGINATAATLRNGYYPSIVWAIKNDVPEESWTKTPIPAEVDTWGTHGFAAYLRTLVPTPAPAPPLHPPTPTPSPTEEIDMLLVRVPNGSVYLLGPGMLLSVVNGANEAAFIAKLGQPVETDQAFYSELMVKFPQVALPPTPVPVLPEPLPAPVIPPTA